MAKQQVTFLDYLQEYCPERRTQDEALKILNTLNLPQSVSLPLLKGSEQTLDLSGIDDLLNKDLTGETIQYKNCVEYLRSYKGFIQIISMSPSEAKPFSEKWFFETSQLPEYRKIAEECKKARNEFLSSYSLEILKSLSGKELLNKMFINDESKTNYLCYELEHNKALSPFGGIAGGSAYKFGIFYQRSSKRWLAGASTNPTVLPLDEAIDKAAEIRDCVVKGAEIIEQWQSNGGSDYSILAAQMETVPYTSYVWVKKYYQMLYPEIFSVWYSESVQVEVLNFLGIKLPKTWQERSGLINQFAKNCGLSSWIFAKIYEEIKDKTAVSVIQETGDSVGDSKRVSHNSWMVDAGNDFAADSFLKNGMVCLGWGQTGNLLDFSSRKEIQECLSELSSKPKQISKAARALYELSRKVESGDTIYLKNGSETVFAKGIVKSPYKFNAEASDDQKHQIQVDWVNRTDPWISDGLSLPKNLLSLLPEGELLDKLEEHFNVNSDSDPEADNDEHTAEPYTREDFLSEVFLDPEQYDRLVGLLRYKKNIVLQGPPGVGKTYLAKRLAYSIIGEKNPEQVMMIQFHQSYSYEDFVIGYRPNGDGFELKTGPFYDFCKKAEGDPDNEYFFIIDEINRGNLSKIFGELFMLVEADKRGIELKLMYDQKPFSIPENVYLIGTMNTADRSLALIDYALRRRFAFFDLKPGFDSDGFRKYQKQFSDKKLDSLIDTVIQLNKEIEQDDSLGEGFEIGHSYFCSLPEDQGLDSALSGLVEYELIPLIKEYWFDNPTKIRIWSESLRRALK